MNDRGSNVVSFVDRATLEIRKQAVRRVREAGIFRLPPGLNDYANDDRSGEKK